ncbi:hypothetical protein LTR17_002753 [Elasticomyces elasticus]|nr:hypothetical protein LTR17_002753 [Elasticomyces elasticus]
MSTTSDLTGIKAFPLLSLPPELWIRICTYAIDARNDLIHWPRPTIEEIFDHDMANDQAMIRYAYAKLRQPAITLASRVLRAELLPYFYAHRVRMQFYLGHINDGQLKWLDAIGQKNRKNLRRVELMAWPEIILLVTKWTGNRLNPIKFQVEDATQRPLETRFEGITEIIGNFRTPLVYPLTFL